MKQKLLLALSLLLAAAAMAPAQDIDPEKAKESTAILAKMRKVELLNELLPLVLTRDQILQILPTIERARAKTRELTNKEHDALLQFDKSSDATINAAMKGKVPDQSAVRDIEVFYEAVDINRQAIMGQNIDAMMEVLQKVLNKGQMKVMANSLTLKFFEPDVTTAEEKDDNVKERVFVREVLLDPLTYDLFIQMTK
jgi:hypothetical protein